MMTYKHIVTAFLVLFSMLVNAQEKDKNLPQGNDAFNEKNFTEAEANYRISASKFPDKANAYYNLGNTIYSIKQPSEAKYAYQNAIKNATTRSQKHQAYHNLGNAFMKEKNYQAAVSTYKQALINNPSDEETRYNFALAKKMLKENPPKDDKKNDKEKDQKKEQDQKDKDDKKDNDKDKKDDKGDKDKDKDSNDGKDKDDKNKENPKPKEGQISKQRLENLLDAVNNEEKKVQDKVNAKKVKGKPVENEKNW